MSSLLWKVLSLQHVCLKQSLFVSRSFSSSALLCKTKERPSNKSLINWKKLPIPKKPEKDYWSEKRALFGENDYKDILGDGTWSLRKNIKTGPWWMRGWKGNELQMLIRKRKVVGYKMGPEERHNVSKRITYLYKFLNRNKGKGHYKGDR